MSYNKFRFKDLKEFISVQRLASDEGYKTNKEFQIFLEANFSQNKK